MGRGDDNILFDPIKLSKGRGRVDAAGTIIPSQGKKIFLSGDKTLVLTEEDNLVEMDFSGNSYSPSPAISHTERASVFPGTYVAFHENGVGYDQLTNPSVSVHHQGNRWTLGLPFVEKDRGTAGLVAQALRGQVLLYDPEAEKVHLAQIPGESEMAYTESLLSPRLWQERTVNVERFIPGDGGALLFFRGDTIPLYLDADGQEYSGETLSDQVFSGHTLGRASDFMHAPTGTPGEIYFYNGQDLKIIHLEAGVEETVIANLAKPERMAGRNGLLALAFPDKIMVFVGEKLVAEEKKKGVTDLAWREDSLIILKGDRVEEKHISDYLETGRS